MTDTMPDELDAAFDLYQPMEDDMNMSEMDSQLSSAISNKRSNTALGPNPRQGHPSKRPAVTPSAGSRFPTSTRPHTRQHHNEATSPLVSPLPTHSRRPTRVSEVNTIPLPARTSSDNMSIAEEYPIQIPDAEAVSQKALDTVSMVSSRLEAALEEEVALHSATRTELAELKRSHNQLASEVNRLRSEILNMTRASDPEKRGTSAIRTAKEVLSDPLTAPAAQQSITATRMLPPPRVEAVADTAMATGGRPKYKPT